MSTKMEDIINNKTVISEVRGNTAMLLHKPSGIAVTGQGKEIISLLNHLKKRLYNDVVKYYENQKGD